MKKGFTLVEMMAVIAVLGLLVLLVLPNVLKSYKDAKKISFINEAKTIYKASTDKFVTERTKGNKIGLIEQDKDNSTNPLSLSEASDLNYTIRLDNDGKVTAFKLSNAEFCIVGVGDFLDGYSKEDVIELSDEERASECITESLQNNQKFILRLQNKESVDINYDPRIIYLKYKDGWYSDNNLKNRLPVNNGKSYVTKPYKENYYYAGAFATNASGAEVQAINCDGTVSQDATGGGLFTGKEEKPYVEAFSKFIKKYYQITFTGGSGNLRPVKCEYGANDCSLPNNRNADGSGKTLKKTGYIFNGWNSDIGYFRYDRLELPVLTDSNEDSYPKYKYDSEEVCKGNKSVENDITFTADWEAITYHISYNCNTGNGSMSNTDLAYDEEVNLKTNTCRKPGYTFLGWSTNATATEAMYTDGQSISNLTTINNSEIKLYAVYRPNKVQITYYANGGVKQDGTTPSNPLRTVTYTYDSTSWGEWGLPNYASPSGTWYLKKEGYLPTELWRLGGPNGTTKISSDVNFAYIQDGIDVLGLKSQFENGDLIGDNKISLYAEWVPATFVVTLNKGAGISSVSGAGTYQNGDTVTIKASVASGYAWSNWNDEDGVNAIAENQYTFVIDKNINLTATTNGVGKEVCWNGEWGFSNYNTCIANCRGGACTYFYNSRTGYSQYNCGYCSTPTRCGAGTYLQNNTTTCATCDAGYYCPGGSYYKTSTGHQGRKPCPTGKTSNPGAINVSECFDK